MKNALKLLFSSLLALPLTMYAQQQSFPEGTVPNEHNINGAEYPRIGEDRRVHFRVFAPNAQKVEISFRGEMTKEADGYWSLVSKEPEVVGFHYYQIIVDGVSTADPNGKPFFGMGKWVSGIEIPEKGVVLDKPGDLAGLLTGLEPNDVLFIDEIHRLAPVVEEYLYSAMEDYRIDIMIDRGPAARSIQIDLNPFTLVGATTRSGLLTAPLRARFGINLHLEYYDNETLCAILQRSATILNVPMTAEAAGEIASRSRGTPRIANALLRRVRDFAQVKGNGRIDIEIARFALEALNIDRYGLDEIDNKILLTIIDKFKGGPVGITTIATAIGEDAGTVEEVYEPFLIKEGFIRRTPRGREVTELAYKHLGRDIYSGNIAQPSLF